jgi:DNA-binding transcriptional regulator YhcF (GntR family)
MTAIRISGTSGVPVFKQIVDQVVYLIEAGQLEPGQRLPSIRMLAANLGINRNTAARAYAELRDLGHLTSGGRGGMVVTAAPVPESTRARERGRQIVAGAVEQCLALGLTAEEVASLAYHEALHASQASFDVRFVECNQERADYFAKELSVRLQLDVAPLVLGTFDGAALADADLVVTTFFHLAEVKALARDARPAPDEIVAIVVAPHLRTLMQLARLPKGRRIGILYSTTHQAEAIRDSLAAAGLTSMVVATDPAACADLDVVVVPSEDHELAAGLSGGQLVVEFGNVLDDASTRMVSDVLDGLRDVRQRSALAAPPLLPAAPGEPGPGGPT